MRMSQTSASWKETKLGISYAFQQPVRFKGIRVFDLLQRPPAAS